MSLESEIAAFAAKSNRNVEQVTRGVVIKLFSSIILDTPVDTGRLRANWQTTVGKPATGTVSGTDARTPLFRVATINLKGDTDAWLTNNLPYARVAEFGEWNGPTKKVTATGFSRKAPAGMVRKNIIRFQRLLRAEVRRLKV